MRDDENEDSSCINLDGVSYWKMIETQAPNDAHEVNIVIMPESQHGEERCWEAKQREIQNFNKFEVYEEVQDR